jgi:hypothetical protein
MTPADSLTGGAGSSPPLSPVRSTAPFRMCAVSHLPTHELVYKVLFRTRTRWSSRRRRRVTPGLRDQGPLREAGVRRT